MHPHGPPTIVRPLMWRFPLVTLLALVAGCGSQIGDACTSNVDCSPLGTRFCDLSSLNGYCTEADCTTTSCPGDSVCIRFFTPVDNETCDTSQEPIPFSQATCPDVDDRCVCDDTVVDKSAPGGVSCVNSVGHCAPSATERHWCMAKCDHDGDCREGYECRQTGTFGAEPLPAFNNGYGTPAKFCAPTPTPF